MAGFFLAQTTEIAENMATTNSNDSTVLLSSFVTSICLLVSLFLPTGLTIAGCVFLTTLHLFLTRPNAVALSVALWLHWYLIQQFVPILLPHDPFGLVSLTSLPLIFIALWVCLGVEYKRNNSSIRHGILAAYACCYFFLALVLENRPPAAAAALALSNHITVTLVYLAAVTTLLFLGATDFKYLSISTSWLLILPITPFFYMVRVAFLGILTNAAFTKHQQRAPAKPTKRKVRPGNGTLRTNRKVSFPEPGLVEQWRMLHLAKQADPELGSSGDPDTTTATTPTTTTAATAREAGEKEEKMKSILTKNIQF